MRSSEFDSRFAALNASFVDMGEALVKATEFRDSMVEKLNPRWYPEFHIAAPAGWINDPNGLCFFNGRYHVFYQHHPYSTQWGPMHWGHVSSPDLVNWVHEPIALAPSIEADRDGVFSGSAVVADDGTLVLFYTGHQWRNGVDDAEGFREVQCVATSTDGVSFTKGGVVVDCPVVDGVEVLHSRDPKVWRQGDTWYMIFGVSAPRDGVPRGEMWMYSSKDLFTWEFDSVLFQDPNPEVFMLECPDFFALGDHWVLVYSPMGAKADGYAHRNMHNAGYAVGTWAPGTEFSLVKPYEHCDWGHNFYAPQTFEHDGRRILFGWMGSFTSVLCSQPEDQWAGQLTLPRELSLDSDLCLVQKPIHALETGRSLSFSVDWDERISLPASQHYRVKIDRGVSSAERISLSVHRSVDPANRTRVIYDSLAGRVHLDRGDNVNGDHGFRSVPVDSSRESLVIDVFVDRGSVEVFVDEGRYAMSSFSFPPEGELDAEIFVESGSASVEVALA
ncbi:MAG: sucrose-6-phosphate hydrolase [Corynebacterium sp.]|nr:sucrose-6-phosphate hydrolase [Corynebacterium sp.]